MQLKYPNAVFGGPVAENILSLVRESIGDVLGQIAGGGEPLPPFALVLNNSAGRLSKLFPVFWLDEEDSPLDENEGGSLLQEEHRFVFWLATKRVISGSVTPEAQAEATEALRRDTRTYANAVAHIFLSARPKEDLTAGLDPSHQTLPVLTVKRVRIVGPTGGGQEFICYASVEADVSFNEGRV